MLFTASETQRSENFVKLIFRNMVSQHIIDMLEKTKISNATTIDEKISTLLFAYEVWKCCIDEDYRMNYFNKKENA